MDWSALKGRSGKKWVSSGVPEGSPNAWVPVRHDGIAPIRPPRGCHSVRSKGSHELSWLPFGSRLLRNLALAAITGSEGFLHVSNNPEQTRLFRTSKHLK